MSARRTKSEIARDLLSRWISYTSAGYAQFDTCAACGEHGYVAGRSPRSMKCRACHFGKYADVVTD